MECRVKVTPIVRRCHEIFKWVNCRDVVNVCMLIGGGTAVLTVGCPNDEAVSTRLGGYGLHFRSIHTRVE